MYAKFESKHGLFSFGIEILNEACEKVSEEHTASFWRLQALFAARTQSIESVRKIFERGLQKMNEDSVVLFGLDFAAMETGFAEVERARQVLSFLSQFCEPGVEDFDFYKIWEEFEVQYGNENTYRDMLRIKRGVEKKWAVVPPTLKRVKKKIEVGLLGTADEQTPA